MQAKRFVSLLCLLVWFLPGCKKATSPTANPWASASPQKEQAVQPKFDACRLLTNKEIEAVQGAAVEEAKSSERVDGGLRVSQCYYSSAEPNKSVSLALTQSDIDSTSGRAARDFWNEIFGRFATEENGRENDTQKKENAGEREEEKGPTAKKIEGIGEEAYWSGNRVGGALYVLKNDAFIRISVGGADSEAVKIDKSKALAQKAIDRL